MSRPLTTDELKKYSKVFGDCWNLLKEYGMPDDRSDDYWSGLIGKGNDICREAGEDILTVKLVGGLLTGLERYLDEIERSQS